MSSNEIREFVLPDESEIKKAIIWKRGNDPVITNIVKAENYDPVTGEYVVKVWFMRNADGKPYRTEADMERILSLKHENGLPNIDRQNKYLNYNNTFSEIPSNEHAAYLEIFQRYAKVANLRIEFAKTEAEAQVRIGTYSDPSITQGVTVPGIRLGYQTEIFMNRSEIAKRDPESIAHTIFHEFGHALGLNHPAKAGLEEGALDSQYASYRYSTMSYNQHFETDSNGMVSWFRRYPTTPMPFDLIGLEQLYGLRRDVNTGTNVYTVGLNTGFTIYDTDGKDTLSAQGSDNRAWIDLRPGHYSSINTGDLQIGNVFIWKDSQIENAIGGDKDDILMGNDLANTLRGGKGNDKLIGGAGKDHLLGGENDDVLDGVDGEGGDVLEGGSDFDTYYVDAGDKVQDTDGRGAVYFNGVLVGGKEEKGKKGTFKGADGLIYKLQGNTLYVVNPNGELSRASKDASGAQGGMLIIEGFDKEQNDLGIQLEELEDELPEEIKKNSKTVSYTRDGGAKGQMEDLIFSTDTYHATLAKPIEIEEAICLLPQIAGRGKIASLWQSFMLIARLKKFKSRSIKGTCNSKNDKRSFTLSLLLSLGILIFFNEASAQGNYPIVKRLKRDKTAACLYNINGNTCMLEQQYRQDDFLASLTPKEIQAYEKSANNGDRNAMFLLSQIVQEDEEGKRNYPYRNEWFPKALEAKHPIALYQEARRIREKFIIYTRRASKDIPYEKTIKNEAAYVLELLSKHHPLYTPDEETTLSKDIPDYIQKIVLELIANDPDARQVLTLKNYLRTAEEAAMADATGNLAWRLGYSYFEAPEKSDIDCSDDPNPRDFQFLPMDPDKARFWAELAAERGNIMAASVLCHWYVNDGRITGGITTERGRPDLALRWCTLAAAASCSSSANNLSIIYQKGLGVPKDEVGALYWSRIDRERRKRNGGFKQWDY